MSTTVTAIEDTRALIIYRDEFNRLVQQNPRVVMEILATLNRRLRTATEKISSLKFLNAWGKVAKVLLDLQPQIDEEKKSSAGAGGSSPVLSREEMAKIAGISRETFARILNEFEDTGYIQIDKKDIVVTAPAKLKEIISHEL